jgi:hypothetical protein
VSVRVVESAMFIREVPFGRRTAVIWAYPIRGWRILGTPTLVSSALAGHQPTAA